MKESREPENIKRLVAEMGTDLDAFGELFKFYQPRIYGYVFSRVGNWAEAEDLTAVTFEKALRNTDSFDPERARFLTWLYQIANNTVNDHLRKRKRVRIGIEEAEEIMSRRSGSETERIDSHISMIDLLLKLPSKYQEVLALRFFGELDLADIAEILGCTKKCVSTRLYRGLNALGKLLDERGSSAAEER